MSKNVRAEKELYPPMSRWLKEYLKGKYRECEVDAYDDTSEIDLDNALLKHEVPYPNNSKLVGIPIQIDVLGVVKFPSGNVRLAFIEAKKTKLNTHDLGQLLIYCRIADPIDAFLLSSRDMGNLNTILVNKGRTDILKYGEKNDKNDKKIHVATWDVQGKHPKMETMVPII